MADTRVERLEIAGSAVSAELYPAPASPGFILGHGAGGDRTSPVLRGLAARLAAAGHPVALYNFPYSESGRKAPDRPPVLERAAIEAAGLLGQALAAETVVLGGKSMGGRIAAQVVGKGKVPSPRVTGLVFIGYPLHGAGREDAWEVRARTLAGLQLPLLFLQGSRDRLCRLDLLERATAGLAATLFVVEEADHSLALPKRAGISAEEVLDRLAGAVRAWLRANSLAAGGVTDVTEREGT